MNSHDFQHRFFQHLKSLLPSYKSLVDEISDLLEISTDSAYRRIRGEKVINLDEIKKISQHFRISLDQLLNLQTDAIVFHGKLNDYSDNRFGAWLEDVHKQLELVYSHKHKHIYFLMKDIPPFYHFYFKELTSFKFFFWMKSILHYENLKGQSFDSRINRFDEFNDLLRKILYLYNRIPSTEIWNEESINTTITQIDLYHKMGLMSNPEDVRLLYSQMLELVNHLEKQAETGKKFVPNKPIEPDHESYRLFVNEFIMGDNTFMAEIDNIRITYLNHSVMYFIGSTDSRFNDAMFNSLDNLMKKSTMISSVGEKDRSQFFNKLKAKIQAKMSLLIPA
ncbi:helix-turn-helix domain-containing protein [Pararhodonellum marinum]|uniref:helix-turn-helix domain-containing protein n=1 Tax=Pararhodonellum marinum TaxID=2755358 RepID=UPI00188EF7A2|nr:helix-turn-helix domain-containing protein [Pararhodonellum marinum]